VSRRLRERTVSASHVIVISGQNATTSRLLETVLAIGLLTLCNTGFVLSDTDCMADDLQVHAPAAQAATSASFLAKLGGIGEAGGRALMLRSCVWTCL
jgi:hypothetical protein